MAAKVDAIVEQGSDFSFTLSVLDSSGIPVDLTGYSITSQIKEYYGANSIAAFAVVLASPAVSCVLSLTAANTGAMDWGRYVYDVLMLDTANTHTRLMEGELTVTPAVTV